MCPARRARVVNRNGPEYTARNIDVLPARRHENQKFLRTGKHPKGTTEHTRGQDKAFARALERIINKSQSIRHIPQKESPIFGLLHDLSHYKRKVLFIVHYK